MSFDKSSSRLTSSSAPSPPDVSSPSGVTFWAALVSCRLGA
eukprot:CAMPEP_0202042068 /NCGR_PEP_ID=MMETSP0962-20130828/26118_1 /ASSEMBLY_ACC=CAM_ASM_000488 /TAXON_ID=4773 /ORGANISM="Schizochytrium aggregatum, Strain ATCC28209" /LENGTH=40 /DNA_ID= /DNA_START= /DNA_END= /DNA_ORIENTATION=